MRRKSNSIRSAASGALLLLLAAPGLAAAADRSRSQTVPPAGSSGGSVSRSSSSSAFASSSPATSRSGRAADTRPSGGVTPGRIEKDTRDGSFWHRGRHYAYPRFHYPYFRYRYHPYLYPYSWSWYGHWGWWGWPYYYAYDPYWWSTGYARVYPNARYGEMGALDLDVRPEKAEVYLDGQFIGRADDFDGFPTYLWLKPGTYDVVFYHAGRRTLARQYTIYSGLILDVEDRMEPGEAVRPEDLPAKTIERREARIQRDREREAEARGREAGREGWRRRYESRRGGGQEEDETVERREAGSQATTLRLQIEPRDASVYLDGRFIGTGEELSRLASGLVIDSGEHRLEAVRPGHRPATRNFSADDGEDLELEIELEPEED